MLVLVNNPSNKMFGLCFKEVQFMKPGNLNTSPIKYPSMLQKKDKGKLYKTIQFQ